jgi:PAS domain S-box-containing protein
MIDYRSCFRQMPALLQLITDKGRVVEVSDQWLQTLGYERKAVVRQPFTNFLAPRLQQQVKALSPAVWLAAAQQHRGIWQVAHCTGHLLEMSATVVVQQDAQNRLNFLVLLVARSRVPADCNSAAAECRSHQTLQLHDSILQLLYSLTLLAEGWRRMAKAGMLPQADEALAELGRIGGQALAELRLLIASPSAPTAAQAALGEEQATDD